MAPSQPHTTLQQAVLTHASSEAESHSHPPSCPECHGNLKSSRSGGIEETVCQSCGLIVDSSTIDYGKEWRRYNRHTDSDDPRRTAPVTQSRFDGGLGTKPPEFETHGAATAQEIAHRNRVANSSSTRSWTDIYATQEINRIGTTLELSQQVIDEAQAAFQKWHDTTGLEGYNFDLIAPAAMLYASRANRCGVTADEFASVARLSRSDSPRAIRDRAHTLADAIGLAVAPPSYHPRLNRISTSLEAPLPWSIIYRAHQLLEATTHLSQSPSALAACTLSRAITTADEKTENSPPESAIADAAGITLRTLRSTHSVIDAQLPEEHSELQGTVQRIATGD